MTGFEPRFSGVEINHSTNWATTTAPILIMIIVYLWCTEIGTNTLWSCFSVTSLANFCLFNKILKVFVTFWGFFVLSLCWNHQQMYSLNRLNPNQLNRRSTEAVILPLTKYQQMYSLNRLNPNQLSRKSTEAVILPLTKWVFLFLKNFFLFILFPFQTSFLQKKLQASAGFKLRPSE